MSRDYKFRGKCKRTGEWVYGYLIQGENSYIVTSEDFYNAVVSMALDMSTSVRIVDPETVGQYTGLKDKNGDWHEGDILSGIFKKQGHAKETGTIVKGQIVYDGGSFIWRTWARNPSLHDIWQHSETDKTEVQWCERARHVGKDSYWEIVDIHKIGNIHENPTLLKEVE